MSNRKQRYWAGKVIAESESESEDSDSNASTKGVEEEERNVEKNTKSLENIKITNNNKPVKTPQSNNQKNEVLKKNTQNYTSSNKEVEEKNDNFLKVQDVEEEEVERRRRLKLRQMQKKREEEEQALKNQAAEESSEESEEETEDESEEESEEEEAPKALLKPVFISKAKREALAEQKKKELQNNDFEGEEAKRQKEILVRKKLSHRMVEDEIRREQADAEVKIAFEVDDTDGLNEEEELEQWRLREFTRIKRDRNEAQLREQERLDTERRRKMTDQEIMEENERLHGPVKEKQTLQFMQRYYHKGAFFMDDESEVLKKSYDQPTLEDKFNKELLPEVMQVKVSYIFANKRKK
ncbi:Microfibrillar-associated protein 1, partial [Clydaea vesicula]